MPTSISVSEKTYRELWKLKEELEKELGMEELSLHKTIQHLIKIYRKYKQITGKYNNF